MKNRLPKLFGLAALILLGALFTLPFLWQVSTSLKTEDQVSKSDLDLIPRAQMLVVDGRGVQVKPVERKGENQVVEVLSGPQKGAKLTVAPGRLYTRPHLEGSNYVEGFKAFPFFKMLKNTLVICVLTVVGTVLSCSLAAYGLACVQWRGRETLFWVMLATMMLPGQVTMIPLFQTFKGLGWINTILPLVVPAFCGNAFFIFMLRQFYRTIPASLMEAARIDGASDLRIWRTVVLPLSKAALAVVAVFSFIAAWNDFLGPLLYLMDDDKYTLAIGLARLQGQYSSDWGRMMAMSVVMTIPLITLFFLAQRTFVDGIKLGGVKG
ncbi:MAG TPA: carbohydrate ABC transporter permease [Fimbriimonadaceae bacterium]|nr:carbohydrate ABC transporter permease [Fimbriimonadaceae bacterium]